MKLISKLTLMGAIIFQLSASAQVISTIDGEGGHVGGGDTLEGRIKDIRDNLYEWILAGGAKELKFASGMDYETYVNGNADGSIQGMKMVLNPMLGNVFISVLHSHEEDPQDEEKNTIVDGVQKTCKWVISKNDNRKLIICNYERFREYREAEQYRLIHHEYAGIAGIERGHSSDSQYHYSNQITKKLIYERVLRLPVTEGDPYQTYSCGVYMRGKENFERHKLQLEAGVPQEIELTDSANYSRVILDLRRAAGGDFYLWTIFFNILGDEVMTFWSHDPGKIYFNGGMSDREAGVVYGSYCELTE